MICKFADGDTYGIAICSFSLRRDGGKNRIKAKTNTNTLVDCSLAVTKLLRRQATGGTVNNRSPTKHYCDTWAHNQSMNADRHDLSDTMMLRNEGEVEDL